MLPANDVGKLTASLQDAQVDLNPHQVEAALFAFKSPLSKGALLADEVGLGKTIEAGIILSQKWAERKRKLLIIGPSNLRKQWNRELSDKFFLPSLILESKSFNQEIKAGNLNPFNQKDQIVICSFHFAKNKAPYLQNINWDLVIIDEAHRLRNVYKPTNKIGNAIKEALSHSKKVLLTATPLQNSILELYGLISLIDPYLFGDLKSFKEQYSRQVDSERYGELQNRLAPVCKRTLRRQVLEYIRYTKRIPLVEEFIPGDDEYQLYMWVSDYLLREKLYALPSSQRKLMTLILRKLLASSTYAIHGTLDSLVKKLDAILDRHVIQESFDFVNDFETYSETEEDWIDEEDIDEDIKEERIYTSEELEEIKEERDDLIVFRDLAKEIKDNSKASHLITALSKGFDALAKLGAKKKALVFTESRRTQDFLYDLLERQGYDGQVVKFNGSNNDTKSKLLFKSYKERHAGTDMLTGSRTADKRAAIVEYFKEEGTIMIATEAAAEGINLQFCSLVVNFDLPWNPQRIEQRIGRCHRYGQMHDVVVINFLNRKNAADVRVFELLDQKFKLFDGVFGASDEVLGSIGNGVDFEKRIAAIYNTCRTPEDIQSAFNQLQEELRPDISEKMKDTRKVLLENFDEEVREKLKANLVESQNNLSKFEERLWLTTKHYLGERATFYDDNYAFTLDENPFPNKEIHPGPYLIIKPAEGQRKSDVELPDNTNIYRAGHPLAKQILHQCKSIDTPNQSLVFDYTATNTRISTIEALVGQSGWLKVIHFMIDSFEAEDYIILACMSEDGEHISGDVAERFFSLEGSAESILDIPSSLFSTLDEIVFYEKQGIVSENAIRNKDFFDNEIDKLDQWADDMKLSLEKEIKDLDAEIKLKKSESKKMLNLEAKVKSQRKIKDLEKKRQEKRRNLFDAQDQVDEKKENLLDEIEARLHQEITETELFTIQWKIV
jgi:superfamily II DNA/RNA helicase